MNLIFAIIGTLSVLCWLLASFFSIKIKVKQALFFQSFGILLFGLLIIWLGIILQRPLFKTMGETRIWYSFFLSILGGVTYWRWKMVYLLTFTNLLASVFVIITICKPEVQSQALMPVLQSVWFIPHVAVYMFAYAAIGCATVLAFLELINFKHKGYKENTKNTKVNCDLLVQIGTAALGIGLCLGAIWAKKAWGQFWSWDIKEIAALITWVIFLLYIHLLKFQKINRKLLLILVLIGFLSLQFTWYGVKYLPVTQKSPHLFYSNL